MSADKFRMEWQMMSKLKQLLMIVTAMVKNSEGQVYHMELDTLDALHNGDTLLINIEGPNLRLQVLSPGAEMLVLDAAPTAAPAQRQAYIEEQSAWPREREIVRTALLDDEELARREQMQRANTNRHQVDSSQPPHQRARVARRQAMQQQVMPPADRPEPLT